MGRNERQGVSGPIRPWAPRAMPSRREILPAGGHSRARRSVGVRTSAFAAAIMMSGCLFGPVVDLLSADSTPVPSSADSPAWRSAAIQGTTTEYISIGQLTQTIPLVAKEHFGLWESDALSLPMLSAMDATGLALPRFDRPLLWHLANPTNPSTLYQLHGGGAGALRNKSSDSHRISDKPRLRASIETIGVRWAGGFPADAEADTARRRHLHPRRGEGEGSSGSAVGWA